MRLADLHPEWLSTGGSDAVTQTDGSPAPSRHGVAIVFDCPCGCDDRLYVPFKTPISGPPLAAEAQAGWDRKGDTFETLTLKPSILRISGCPKQWHGWITNGEVTAV